MIRFPTVASAFACAFAICAAAPSQARVSFGGTPTNLLLDLSSTAVVPEGGSSFLALMPIVPNAVNLPFAVFDSTFVMDSSFGTGNWLRCTMVATDWAYLTGAACAHQPAPGATVPLSLLTTDFDYGPYSGEPGMPQVPIPDATLFGGNSQSFVRGLDNSLSQERWQLRTRGFQLTNPWNGCGSTLGVTPQFSGWLVVRFTYSFA